MSIAEVITRQDFFQNLTDKHKKGRFANAVMFCCKDKLTTEVALTMTALMLNYDTFELFDEDSLEYKKIHNDVNLDILVFPKENEFKVKDAALIIKEAYIKPSNLRNKVFILKNFDNANTATQNKLLKIFEEPPKNVYFLLGVQTADKILPTIKSRCDKLVIPPLSERVSENQLANLLSGGYIGRARELEKMDDLEQVVSLGIDLATKMRSSAQVLSYSKALLEHQDQLMFILEVYLLSLEDMLKIKAEKEDLAKLTPYLDAIKSVEYEFSSTAICEIEQLVNEFLKKMQFNANLPVAVDNLLLKILEVKYLCK